MDDVFAFKGSCLQNLSGLLKELNKECLKAAQPIAADLTEMISDLFEQDESLVELNESVNELSFQIDQAVDKHFNGEKFDKSIIQSASIVFSQYISCARKMQYEQVTLFTRIYNRTVLLLASVYRDKKHKPAECKEIKKYSYDIKRIYKEHADFLYEQLESNLERI